RLGGREEDRFEHRGEGRAVAGRLRRFGLVAGRLRRFGLVAGLARGRALVVAVWRLVAAGVRAIGVIGDRVGHAARERARGFRFLARGLFFVVIARHPTPSCVPTASSSSGSTSRTSAMSIVPYASPCVAVTAPFLMSSRSARNTTTTCMRDASSGKSSSKVARPEARR